MVSCIRTAADPVAIKEGVRNIDIGFFVDINRTAAPLTGTAVFGDPVILEDGVRDRDLHT